jgi:phosphate transport system substrate-binding protein
VKAEEYPLGQRLFLYTNREPAEGVARSLLNFALSPQAQSVIKQTDFVDQSPEKLAYRESASRIAIALNAPRDQFDLKLMNTLIDDLKSADRLSFTFRFQTGSDALDTKALSDVARLHDMLNTPEMRGAQVMLVGFADGVGRFDNNLKLSQRRAQAVQSALTAFNVNNASPGGSKIAVRAYSVLAPVGCNELATGRYLNRRVEVWVKK